MAKDPVKAVDTALAEVENGRRGFLKGLLIGSAALPLLKSEALAQDQGGDSGTGTGKKKKKKKGTDTEGGMLY